MVIVKALWRIVGITIPIPLGVLLAALTWLHFDKESAILHAVNERVIEMVAGAEIAALEAQLEAEKQIAAARGAAASEANRRLSVEIVARTNLAARLAAIQTENEILSDDLEDLLSRPVDRDCAVDDAVLDRLRGR